MKSKIKTFALAVDQSTEARFRQTVEMTRQAGRHVRTVGELLADAPSGFEELPVSHDLRRDAAKLFELTGDQVWRRTADQKEVRIPLAGLKNVHPDLPVVVGYELDLSAHECELLGLGHPGQSECQAPTS